MNQAQPSARDVILAAVRSALPKPAIDLPSVPSAQQEFGASGGFGYQGDLTALEKVQGAPGPGESMVPFFESQLKAMGGQSFVLKTLAEAQVKVRQLFPKANKICSTVAGIPGSQPIHTGEDPHSFAEVNVAIVQSRLAVAEAGAIWLDDADLVVPSLGVLCQNLVILLDPADIVPSLHEAYSGRVNLAEHPYSVFMAGPSATGDIEGVIVHGAQGARTLTVFLMDRS